jgi:ferric-dicitrate binding protein FerR (iron transport regulator)
LSDTTTITDRIADLILKHFENTLTEEELRELEDWKNISEEHKKMYEELTNKKTLQSLIDRDEAKNQNTWQHELEKYEGKYLTKQKRLRNKRVCIGICLLLIGAGASKLIFVSNQRSHSNSALSIETYNSSEKAVTLTLSNGEDIYLADSNAGRPINQSNAVIDQCPTYARYIPLPNSVQETNEYNKITTSSGKQFILHLPDSSKVWLNANTSVRFPTSFLKERKIEITGEAYFEVKHDSVRPFTVSFMGSGKKTDQTLIQVLGTSFNVNAYELEPTLKTTLIEGKIRLIKGRKEYDLKPSQQLVISSNGKVKIDSITNSEESFSWKNNHFTFNDADIGAVMREISRWYDVQVIFEKISMETYTLRFPRNLSLVEVLKMLQVASNSGIKFNLVNNTVYISK